MYKFALKFAAVLVGVLACSLTFTSCGDDDDDDDDLPTVTTGKGGPTSITAMGETVMTFSYDSNGRMTSLRTEDLRMSISYSPLTIKIVEDDDITTFSDISLNSSGFITKAKVTESYDGEQDVYWETHIYDKNGHLTESVVDGDHTYFKWENGNLISISDEDVTVTFTYSNQKNTAGVCSPMWTNGIYIMTGLFGQSTANFPSAIESDGERMSFSYKLLDDGRISKETMSMEGYPIEFTYNYGGGRASAADASSAAVKLPKMNINPFKRIRK